MKKLAYVGIIVAIVSVLPSCLSTLMNAAINEMSREGNPDAQALVALEVMKGTGGHKKNPQEAFRLMQQPASVGNANAQALLGGMYIEGIGTPKNEAEGIAWMKKSADQGNDTAISYLGACYVNGLCGLPVNRSKGMSLLREGASKGNDTAKTILSRGGAATMADLSMTTK